ncbi:portal protein [Achromobacter aloeverae]|uniref:Portal protein n=1 Tax=Achromobacter aloeverae TaxID=1750518 RepID=A0A4Q1HIP9_9BURK|nr:portal protein [Achromobacter aloeverae]RXN88009.1 hypothetical protein C7R54_15650 [Achromobacter aloeverae]
MSEELIARAHRRFKACQDWESTARQRFADDIRFCYADPDNHEQWNAAVRAQRQLDGRPMLTINKTHTHVLHVVNDAKENKPSVKVHPVGSEATYESAQVFEGVIRHIEYISDAQTAYDIATENMVAGGIGYWRITTAYTDDNGFDQEIFIKEVPDPLAVYLDPNIKKRDGSDAKYGFVYDEWPREEFERKYPDAAASSTTLGEDIGGWLSNNRVRVAEYYEVVESKEWMYALPNGDGTFEFLRESAMTKEQKQLIKKTKGQELQRRKVDKREVKWYLIAANAVIDESRWAGKYIPIVRCVGEEIILDGKLDRKGLVRYMKDAQRMYNYNTSAAVEYGALQTKAPWVGPIEAFEGHENYWATANRENYPYLPFNGRDELGNDIPAPQRPNPPSSAPVYMDGMQAAAQEMMMTSGQYEATFSEQGNEISGKAIDQRQRQGQRATYHFIDGVANAIRYTGKQLLDLIPKIYDTKRVIRIMAEDGEQQQIQIDPEQRQGVVEQGDDKQQNAVQSIFNPQVGTFDVVVEIGPNYQTRRQEAFNAMRELISAVPQLAQVIGDLFMANGDFPSADKLAERMRNWIPKEIQGEGPTQQEQQLMQQNQQLIQMVQNLGAQLESKQNLEKIEKQRADIDALNHMALRMENTQKAMIDSFKAETDRLKAVQPMMTPEAMEPILRKLMVEILKAPDPIIGDDPGELNGGNAFAIGMQGTTVGIPLVQEPQPTAQAG